MPQLNVDIIDLTGAAVTANCLVKYTGIVSAVSGQGPTATGNILFTLDTPDTYNITVQADWYKQFAAVSVDIGTTNVSTSVRMSPDPIFELHLDEDRNGTVDPGLPTGAWEFGPGKKGAVVFYNGDDDAARGYWFYDADDTIVDSKLDELDIAPLEVKRTSDTVPTSVVLKIANSQGYLRIFDGLGDNSKEILGPQTADTLTIDPGTFPSGTTKSYGMEALSLACKGWDGYANIQLVVQKASIFPPNAPTTQTQDAKVRVAPWIMTHHRDVLQTVFMAEAYNNFVTRAGVFDILRTERLNTIAPQSNDVWLQDCMKIGYSTLPRPGKVHRVSDVMLAYRTGNNRELYAFPITLRGPERAFADPAQATRSRSNTYDSHGNLACTPPVKDRGGKEYKMGRIYYGMGSASQPFNNDVKLFLERQEVQRPFSFDTNFMVVGHVDEILTFLPCTRLDKDEFKQWKLLVASPAEAYRILEAIAVPARATTPMFGAKTLWSSDPRSNAQYEITLPRNVRDFLTGTIGIHYERVPGPNYETSISGPDLKTINLAFQATINNIVNVFKTEVGLEDPDVIPVPVVFYPDGLYPDGANDKYSFSALTADMVNMLITNKSCIVPRSYGPNCTDTVDGDFEDSLRTAITTANAALTVGYVDDWAAYHQAQGEIHCGTNSWRQPSSAEEKWWTFVPPT